MPRFYTSPPPVYARNWANGQNLVESTKIERQIAPSIKVHRKEKKEKKREKKLKNEKSKQQYFPSTKQVSDESEQHEKSCLTEEHHLVGYLSDGSQNSKKRRREASPVVDSNIKATPVAGNPLRIRFVFKKPKEAEVAVPQEDRVCSTSGTDRPSEITSSVPVLDENLLSAPLENGKTAIPSESNKRKKRRTSKESRYNSLFDECVLPSISMEEENGHNDDWLFCARAQENAPTKSSEDMVTNLQKSGESSLPRAQFLPEAGIFSLPYAVLF
ncbi:hypothetical protein EUTSA_v10008464mg [Eutrema salsugineum]|uniref:Uncharacterized protein n=1 Tax=Eutrema salsugineum TaxID=72664 RepID=V4L4V3_EUTSA|nr:uncharacterized protein LOC18992921 [Eutrema salsugineum]ESQ34788.1 hypothetical protein EUTSA_v10008464mg [Eutrema salsugineum]